MNVGFVLSNPKHHAEMMAPVAAALRQRGHRTTMISLAELRGFVTPSGELIAALPWRVRKTPQVGADFGIGNQGEVTLLRKAAQAAILAPLLPRVAWLLRDCDAVLVPNDAAYPYAELVRALRALRKPVALLQEGIRFPLPTEAASARVYGASGVALVCAWGEGSAEHLRAVARAGTEVKVTGNPRFDELETAVWRARGQALLAAHHLGDGPFLYLSNPVDDQRFCSTAEKLALFERFAERAAEELVRRAAPLVVKLHPREDAAAFRRAAARLPLPIVLAADEPLFAWLAVARGAVVLASTVGLEALRFGVPLGVLPLPGHGHVFEYTTRGAAVAVGMDAVEAGVAEIFDGAQARRSAAVALVARHLGGPGDAASAVASAVEELARRAARSVR